MTSLNDEMADAQSQVNEVRNHLRQEIPELFEFDVIVGGIEYNANNNTVTITVEPSADAREQLSDRFGGVKVKIQDELTFQFQLTSTERVE
ncbi:hypothetical protein [Halosolutus halophilus]|uniref:hypothetical protein n=1 Tax=Halosolutus halophilus TaxID=1552990 RepID=UPI0022351824|nr:hypothetical protein [Halosolutus halophilus]